MIGKVTLILGGIRSGKTFQAEELALGYGRRPVYLATSKDPDEEMRTRIRTSQRRRGDRFELIEEPYDLRPALSRCAGRTVLVDGLADHLVNRLSKQSGPQIVDQIWENDRGYLNELLSIQKEKEINLILVSNEMGMLPMADSLPGRVVPQLMGHWNRHLAHLSQQVIVTEAGISRIIKQERAARFRLGAQAALFPGDLLQSVLFLRRQVDDIQLCFHKSPPADQVLSEQQRDLLLSFQQGTDLSFSVHMPVYPSFHENPARILEQSSSLIESLAELQPFTHTFHFDLDPSGTESERNRYLDTYGRFFGDLIARFPGVPFSLENVSTPLHDLDSIIDGCAISYAINLGHLLLLGHPLSEMADRLSRSAVVHLHHAADHKDHLPLPRFAPYLSLLTDFTGLVTIENDYPAHLEQSLETMKRYF